MADGCAARFSSTRLKPVASKRGFGETSPITRQSLHENTPLHGSQIFIIDQMDICRLLEFLSGQM
jgi:hypothetical protein